MKGWEGKWCGGGRRDIFPPTGTTLPHGDKKGSEGTPVTISGTFFT